MAINIKKANKGKFTAYKERTGKTTEEALHSKDAHVRQMANFAKNAKKWKHGDGGLIIADDGTLIPGVPAAPVASVTPEERQAFNTYHSALVSAPGRYVRNWDHNEDFQKQTAAQTGWDYSRNGAIQNDMQSGSHAVTGVAGSDPWGGNPAWMGSRESNKAYTSYVYQQADKNGKVYYTENKGTEAIPQNQMSAFTDRAHQSIAPTWQTNDQGIPMDASNADLMKLPNNANAYNPAAPFVDKTQAIQNRQARDADTTGKYDNMYEKDATPTDYSIDSIRQGQDDPQYAKCGGTIVKRLYKTPLPQKQGFPTAPTYGKGGKIRRYDDGGADPVQPQTPPTGNPQAPPQVSHNNIGFSTNGLVLAGLQGADALVTQDIYNPRVRAREALLQKDMSTTATGPNDFYGHDMGMYGDGGRTRPKAPANGSWDYSPEYKQYFNNDSTWAAQQLRSGNSNLGGNPDLIYDAPSSTITPRREVRMQAYNAAQDAYNATQPMSQYFPDGFSPALPAAQVGFQKGRGGMVRYATGGQSDEDFETSPGQANALVESGEQLRTPDGSTMPVTGDEQHSDKPNGMGGKYMDLDPGTQVFSKKKLIDKNTASAITDTKFTRKASPADLVKKYKTDNEEDILNSKFSDPIAITTANMMKGIKDGKKDQVFQAQEIATGRAFGGPQMEFGGTMMAGRGGFIRAADGISMPGLGVGNWNVPQSAVAAPPIDQTINMPVGPHSTPDDFYETQTPYAPTDNSAENLAGFAKWAQDNPGPTSPGTTPPTGLQQAWRGARDFVGNHTHGNLRDAALYAPEAMATIHAMTDQPIWSQKYQPVYNKANTLNVQADLNRQQSLAYPMFQRSAGNAGVDSGRRMGGLATLIDASNQLGQAKDNYDSTQRAQTDNSNAAIENDANQKNIQLANQISDKMAQRQFNKDRTLENVTQSATDKGYALQQGRAYENNSLGVLNKMYPNWQYDQAHGLTSHANGSYFHVPYGGIGPQQSYDPKDDDTETKTGADGKKYVRKISRGEWTAI